MTNTVLLHSLASRDEREDGFTLIEILVVIIIIGLLAAVAIPIFLNQRKATVDAQTKADVRNLISSVELGRVSNPDAKYYELWNNDMTYKWGYFDGLNPIHLVTGGHYYVDVDVDDPHERIKGSRTKGTAILLYSGEEKGEYRIVAWNANGGQYTTSPSARAAGKALVYESGTGQFRDSQAGDRTDTYQVSEREARKNKSL